MLRRFAISLVLAMLLALTACAQDYQKGRAAAKRGDYATALKEWRPLAEKGDAKAQRSLGQMYRRGQGVPQDFVMAYMWLSLAAPKLEPFSQVARDRVAKRMTPAQIAQGQKLAREWQAKHPKKK